MTETVLQSAVSTSPADEMLSRAIDATLRAPHGARAALFGRLVSESAAYMAAHPEERPWTWPERPDLAKVEKTTQDGGGRETLRAYLGTIPDYTTEVKGVKLSGVRGASPAEKAGLKGGDVIIEFAGQKIANIYDYTYALDAVKIGAPVQVVIERDGKQMTLTVTPEARK